ncbi:MAG: hypothetical protein EA420_01610 [Candidatus Competibacteraceae bacterium]|nr:MAG: hypothetical protein EA420_01610 [Candidatus Competibacteraceae bacterium]
MNMAAATQERLAFLVRVVDKEIKHLDYADRQVFNQPLEFGQIQTLEQNPDLALKIEAFTSRFCRLQDTLGDKLLPALLKALGESEQALLINLNKAEKYGWLSSAEAWIQLRQLRNQMIHEYIEDPQILYNALVVAHDHLNTLKHFANQLMNQIDMLRK